MPITPSPLRYPGGKTQLYHVVKDILVANNLLGVTYAEPFAGGCGLALKLLFKGDVKRIIINDYDVAVYSFWFSILNHTDQFCSLIKNTEISVTEWKKQKEVYSKQDIADIVSLGFATFFLNRTNISGIIKGGIVGGQEQHGTYSLDARFNKEGLIKRIEKIVAHKKLITLHNMDAAKFINQKVKRLKNAFINFDPPYVKKGSSLYKNSYSECEHYMLSKKIADCSQPWIVTYDICPLVKNLYSAFRGTTLGINYSIGTTRDAREYIFFSDSLTIPSHILNNQR